MEEVAHPGSGDAPCGSRGEASVGATAALAPRVADYLVAIGADLTTDAGKRLVARLAGVQNFNHFHGADWVSLTGAQRSEALITAIEAPGGPIAFDDDQPPTQA